VTLAEISASLAKSEDKIKKSLDSLLAEGKIKSVIHKGLKYFEPK